jgi:hypothetical protein
VENQPQLLVIVIRADGRVSRTHRHPKHLGDCLHEIPVEAGGWVILAENDGSEAEMDQWDAFTSQESMSSDYWTPETIGQALPCTAMLSVPDLGPIRDGYERRFTVAPRALIDAPMVETEQAPKLARLLKRTRAIPSTPLKELRHLFAGSPVLATPPDQTPATSG